MALKSKKSFYSGKIVICRTISGTLSQKYNNILLAILRYGFALLSTSEVQYVPWILSVEGIWSVIIRRVAWINKFLKQNFDQLNLYQ